MGWITTILSGLAVGAAMTIPGVSGGSAAMILGIYDRLVSAVSNIFTEPKRSIPLLLKFTAGAAAGMLLIARLISFLLTTPAEVPLRFVFLGAVAGGIPMIFRKAGVRRITAGTLTLVLVGMCCVLLLSALPEGIFAPGTGGFLSMIVQFLGGILLAAALVLPGISASHFLYILGIYDSVMENVSNFELLPLLPMALGAVIGAFLTARALESLIERHPAGTFLVILGFMLASLRELLPQDTEAVQIIFGAPCVLVGFIPVYCLQSDRRRNNRRSGKSRDIV